ncbi:STAS domain-containing protein [Effusibacillus consociatus]|uniref:STAS domain-containing protein n=1 Tax=Effusibacillus consociatus TaxID=1117041 RepID=A0ABV9Q3J3_9BACL
MSLSVQVTQASPQSAVVKVEGEVDIFTVDHLLAAIEKCNAKTIVLNCEGLVFIDSTGIGLLLRKMVELKEQGINVTFDSVPEPIDAILDEMGIYEILDELNGR